ncbi:hypothetical protein ES705_45252 [subsurface metagenome]
MNQTQLNRNYKKPGTTCQVDPVIIRQVDPGLPEKGGVGSSLVSVKNKCNNKVDRPHPCGCWSYLNSSTGQVVPFHCKRWRCPHCGRINRRLLLKALGREAVAHSLQRFVTLTLPSQIGLSPEAEVYLLKVWAKFRVYLERRFGRRPVYLWVKERKNGRLHLHCLVDRYIPQRWLSSAWERLGGGRVVDIRFVDLHRVTGYLTKYLTKEFYDGVSGRHYGSAQTVCLVLRPKKKGKSDWAVYRRQCRHYSNTPRLNPEVDQTLSCLAVWLLPQTAPNPPP